MKNKTASDLSKLGWSNPEQRKKRLEKLKETREKSSKWQKGQSKKGDNSKKKVVKMG
jgi:hypothetical protein